VHHRGRQLDGFCVPDIELVLTPDDQVLHALRTVRMYHEPEEHDRTYPGSR
jgi:hypothetical protein